MPMLGAGPICAIVTILLAGAPPVPSAPPHARTLLHVRSTGRQMLDVVREGRDRSATFRRLVDELEGSDVIVYLQPDALPLQVEAHMRFAGAAGGSRYLRVTLNEKAHGDRLIALIGHELQHAREVARAAAVRDDAALASLYRRIGDQNARGWDTEAACVVGDLVRRELQQTCPRPNGQ